MLPHGSTSNPRDDYMIDSNGNKKGDAPTESDELAADAAVNEGGKSKKVDPPDDVVEHPEPNPPRTTTAKFFTAPKFGSAGSGGLEIEPGLDVD
jgi:hypothetical protein